MQIEIKMTVNDFDELATVLDGLKAQGLDPRTTVAPIKSEGVAVAPVQKQEQTSVKTAKPAPVVAKDSDFDAFRQAVTTLLAQNHKNNAFFKDFLTTKGYRKLSDVPETERKKFIQDFKWTIEGGETVDDDDLPF